MTRVTSLVLALLLALPVGIVIGVIYLVFLLAEKSPRPSFFCSEPRLGKNSKLYKMYMIRTMHDEPDASGAPRVLKMGRFLYYNRLEDLPQLWNVLRGEMSMIGPRPVRPDIYEAMCKEQNRCDLRFSVCPGMIGYGQLLSAPSASISVQYAIDNHYVKKGIGVFGKTLLLFWGAWSSFGRSLKGIGHQVVAAWRRSRGISNLRKYKRFTPEGVCVQMVEMDFEDNGSLMMPICDVNYEAVSFYADEHFEIEQTLFFYLGESRESRTGTFKRARCCGFVYSIYDPPADQPAGQKRYVVFFEPVSPKHRHVIDRYVLRDAVA